MLVDGEEVIRCLGEEELGVGFFPFMVLETVYGACRDFDDGGLWDLDSTMDDGDDRVGVG